MTPEVTHIQITLSKLLLLCKKKRKRYTFTVKSRIKTAHK